MVVADVFKGRLWLEVVLPGGDYLHGGGERICLVGTRGYEETMCFTNTCYHPLTPSAPPLPVQLVIFSRQLPSISAKREHTDWQVGITYII